MQPSLWKGLFAAEVADLWEPWMQAVDEFWQDDELRDTARAVVEWAKVDPAERWPSG